MQIPTSSTPTEESIQYFTQNVWGIEVEDDKYWTSEELEDNWIIFYTYAYAHLGLPRPSTAQYRIAEFVGDRTNAKRLVWAMRGIAKSLTSQIYTVWRLLNDPNEKILVLSKSSGRAKSYTQFVKKLLKQLPVTLSMYPRNNIERTSGESFDVVGAMASDSPSVYAAGVGNEITGMRASLLVIDDVETHITVHSAALTEKVQHGVDEAYKLLMSGHLESITLATPHTQNSIYLEWLENGTKGFIVPAEYPEDQSVYMGLLAPFISERVDADPSLVGQAVDERIDKDFLIQQRAISKRTYRLQYLLDISESDDFKYPLKLSDLIVMDVDDDEAPLKVGYSSMPDNMLYMKHNGFKKDKLYMPSYTSEDTSKYDMKVMSVDPSGRGRDETGVTILYALNTRIFLKKITGLQGGYDDEALNNIASLCKQHDIGTLVVEGNFGDGMFLKMLEPHMRRVSPRTEIDEVRAKGQKELRIIDNIEPIVSQHRLIVDKNTLDKDMNALNKNSFTYQFSHITTDRDCLMADDRLDSLALGIEYMIDKIGDDEQFGFEMKLDDELKEIEAMNNNLFGNSWGYRRQAPNYGSNY